MPAAGPVVVDGLVCRLGGREVLRGIDLSVEAGTFVGILGANGSGKTTLLRCIAGLQPFQSGRVRILGEDVAALPPAALARRLALQAQDDPGALGFSVADVVGMGRLAHRAGLLGGASREDERIVADALAAFDLTASAHRPVETLSGGERQRVTIARALAQQPSVLLLDEPTNHLDVRHQLSIMERVRRLGITVVATLHDIQLAARTCDRLAVLSAGRIVAQGTPEEVVTPDTIARAYGVAATVDRHPATHQIRVDLQPIERGPTP